jgi:hypothetical protein
VCSIITNGWGESKPIAFGPILVTDTGSKLGTLQLRALQLRALQLGDVILEADGFAKVLEARTLKDILKTELKSI